MFTSLSSLPCVCDTRQAWQESPAGAVLQQSALHTEESAEISEGLFSGGDGHLQ